MQSISTAIFKAYLAYSIVSQRFKVGCFSRLNDLMPKESITYIRLFNFYCTLLQQLLLNDKIEE